MIYSRRAAAAAAAGKSRNVIYLYGGLRLQDGYR